MARNRKRSKERRNTRRPASGPGARPGVATARGLRGDPVDPDPVDTPDVNETPGPLDHATPDAELAEAQLARGRDQDGPAGRGSRPPVEDGAVYTDEVTESEADDDADAALVRASGGAAAPRSRPIPRLITFLQGSWRELQRVQWPDRRQVVQATGVVIGFVVVAGLYLGLADTVAAKLADLILK
ncbi:MAG: preprotein translocase subunit SecE [Actinomycetota bacterium]|nr:preprotein translocase subunit SecE [Actinomycetota bacterium]